MIWLDKWKLSKRSHEHFVKKYTTNNVFFVPELDVPSSKKLKKTNKRFVGLKPDEGISQLLDDSQVLIDINEVLQYNMTQEPGAGNSSSPSTEGRRPDSFKRLLESPRDINDTSAREGQIEIMDTKSPQIDNKELNTRIQDNIEKNWGLFTATTAQQRASEEPSAKDSPIKISAAEKNTQPLKQTRVKSPGRSLTTMIGNQKPIVQKPAGKLGRVQSALEMNDTTKSVDSAYITALKAQKLREKTQESELDKSPDLAVSPIYASKDLKNVLENKKGPSKISIPINSLTKQKSGNKLSKKGGKDDSAVDKIHEDTLELDFKGDFQSPFVRGEKSENEASFEDSAERRFLHNLSQLNLHEAASKTPQYKYWGQSDTPVDDENLFASYKNVSTNRDDLALIRGTSFSSQSSINNIRTHGVDTEDYEDNNEDKLGGKVSRNREDNEHHGDKMKKSLPPGDDDETSEGEGNKSRGARGGANSRRSNEHDEEKKEGKGNRHGDLDVETKSALKMKGIIHEMGEDEEMSPKDVRTNKHFNNNQKQVQNILEQSLQRITPESSGKDDYSAMRGAVNYNREEVQVHELGNLGDQIVDEAILTNRSSNVEGRKTKRFEEPDEDHTSDQAEKIVLSGVEKVARGEQGADPKDKFAAGLNTLQALDQREREMEDGTGSKGYVCSLAEGAGFENNTEGDESGKSGSRQRINKEEDARKDKDRAVESKTSIEETREEEKVQVYQSETFRADQLQQGDGTGENSNKEVDNELVINEEGNQIISEEDQKKIAELESQGVRAGQESKYIEKEGDDLNREIRLSQEGEELLNEEVLDRGAHAHGPERHKKSRPIANVEQEDIETPKDDKELQEKDLVEEKEEQQEREETEEEEEAYTIEEREVDLTQSNAFDKKDEYQDITELPVKDRHANRELRAEENGQSIDKEENIISVGLINSLDRLKKQVEEVSKVSEVFPKHKTNVSTQVQVEPRSEKETNTENFVDATYGTSSYAEIDQGLSPFKRPQTQEIKDVDTQTEDILLDELFATMRSSQISAKADLREHAKEERHRDYVEESDHQSPIKVGDLEIDEDEDNNRHSQVVAEAVKFHDLRDADTQTEGVYVEKESEDLRSSHVIEKIERKELA